MFVSKYVSLPEAIRIIKDQHHLPDDADSPLLSALEEGAISAEIFGKDGWKDAPADWWRKPAIAWPHQYQQVVKREGQVYPTEIRVARNDLEALWPTKPLKTAASAGGRPPKWDWEAAMIELARIAVHDDDPNPTTMTKKITEWFAERNGGEAPVVSQIREKVRIFHEAIWPPRT